MVVRYRGAEEIPGDPPPEGIPKPAHEPSWIGTIVITTAVFLIVIIGLVSMMSQHS
jgi:hypothetical protein